jgi:hypothetical protein
MAKAEVATMKCVTVHATAHGRRDRGERAACPFVPLEPVPVACPSSRVLAVTGGHWRSTETVSDQELKAVTCTGRGRDKKLGNRCSIP